MTILLFVLGLRSSHSSCSAATILGAHFQSGKITQKVKHKVSKHLGSLVLLFLQEKKNQENLCQNTNLYAKNIPEEDSKTSAIRQ